MIPIYSFCIILFYAIASTRYHYKNTYLNTLITVLLPMYLRSIYYRLAYYPLPMLEIESSISFLTLYMIYKYISENYLSTGMNLIIGLLNCYLVFSPPVESSLLRVTFFTTFCLLIQSISQECIPSMRSYTDLLVFLAMLTTVSVDVWMGNFDYFHLLLVFSIPHMAPIETYVLDNNRWPQLLPLSHAPTTSIDDINNLMLTWEPFKIHQPEPEEPLLIQFDTEKEGEDEEVYNPFNSL